MADQRKGGISWCDCTWNPVRGCSRVSEGCRHCFAERQAARFSGPGQPYEGLVRHATIKDGGSDPLDSEAYHTEARWTGVVRLVPDHLADPLRWRRPRKVFVNSMSDLFHEALSDEDIAAVFGIMAAAPQHTFQILTKRASRMREWFARIGSDAPGRVAHYEKRGCALAAARVLGPGLVPALRDVLQDAQFPERRKWPLSNVWLGISVEDQKRADERIPELLATPAAVRWVSYEPAIEDVEFQRDRGWLEPFQDVTPSLVRTPRISWIVVGGESGPGARPFDLSWARSTIRQCREAGAAVFVKQLGDNVRGDTRTVPDRHTGKPMHLFVRRWILDDGTEWVPPLIGAHASERPLNAVGFRPMDAKGGTPDQWPEDLRIRCFPEVPRAE